MLTALATLAPTADAAIPRDAPVVAGPTPSGARVVAFDRGGRLCMALLEPDLPRRFVYPQCERPRHRLRGVDLDSSYDGNSRRMVHYGIVEPQVAEVELVLSGGRTLRSATYDGAAYTGRHAGTVRFLLIEDRGRQAQADPRYVKLYAADGSLLGIADQDFYPGRVGGTALASGTLHGDRWSLRVSRERTLAPLPGNEERFVRQTCVQVRAPSEVVGGRPRTTRTCIHPDDTRERDSFALDQTCARIGITAVGVVDSDVRAVTAVLGDGSVRRLPLKALPAGYPKRRAFALVLGPRSAVRRVVAISRGAHHRVLSGPVGPAALRCGTGGSVIFGFGDEPPTPRGPATLTVYDEGVWLCATLGRPTRQPGECGAPPIDADGARVFLRREGGRQHIAGIVSADVTSAVVELDDGQRVTVETRADQSYVGLYSGRVRFFTVTLQPGQSVVAVRVVETSGRRVTVESLLEEPRQDGSPRLVVPGPPGLRLRATWVGWAGMPHNSLCLQLGGSECDFASTFSLEVMADCSPRRLVLWGLLTKGRTSVTVETDRGEVRAAVRRLPPRLRGRGGLAQRFRRYAAVSAFVVAIPRNARPTAIVMDGRRTQRRRLVVPPASAQCGYRDFLFPFL